MKTFLLPVFVGAALFLVGCGPKEPAAPVVAGRPEAELRRERWFGAEIANQAGIEWRASGLGIQILEPGEGEAPKPTDKVRVHYIGRLLDGTEFDNSYARGQPLDNPVAHFVTGFAAALPAMKPGGKARFYIPPQLGYGGLRAGKIPPNSSLVFEVELLAVNPEGKPDASADQSAR